MILFELTNRSELDPAYKELEVANGVRHYGFLESAVRAALATNCRFLSQTVIKALNFHVLACLHSYCGKYRPCGVTVGRHIPPDHYRIADLMDDFVNRVNRNWNSAEAVLLAAFVLWRLNHIHPFINGNGRTARAACYFVLCVKSNGWLMGRPILPELLKHPHNRPSYIDALQQADKTADLSPLRDLLKRLLAVQMQQTRL